MIKNKSFTLIELLVVIVIIGILAGLIIVSTSSSIGKANFAKAQAFSNTVQQELLLNLVSEWTFDNVSNLGEDTWENNNGVLGGGTAIYMPIVKNKEDCVYGNCLYFNGDDYIEITNMNTPALSEVTVGAWVNLDTDKTGEEQIVSINPIQLYYRLDNLTVAQSNVFSCTVVVGNIRGAWHYVSYTMSSSSVKLYLDGELKKSIIGSTQTAANPKIVLGNYYTGGNYYLKGLLDDVRIYKAALSSSQIKQNYIAGLNSLLANNNISNEEYNERLSNIVNYVKVHEHVVQFKIVK